MKWTVWCQPEWSTFVGQQPASGRTSLSVETAAVAPFSNHSLLMGGAVVQIGSWLVGLTRSCLLKFETDIGWSEVAIERSIKGETQLSKSTRVVLLKLCNWHGWQQVGFCYTVKYFFLPINSTKIQNTCSKLEAKNTLWPAERLFVKHYVYHIVA